MSSKDKDRNMNPCKDFYFYLHNYKDSSNDSYTDTHIYNLGSRRFKCLGR